MKKNLLATSALVAAGALASQGALAEAKPIEIAVGGYYEQWVGFVSQYSDAGDNERTNATDLDVQEDGEIHFKGSTTLDNGLTFGVNVQLEAATSGDQIDENYLFVRGSFGEIVLGSENGPAYAMHYGVDIDQGYGLEEGDTGFYWFTQGTIAQLHTTRLATLDNDGQKIRWISPRFEGLQIGLSYTPEGVEDRDGAIPNEFDNFADAQAFEQIFAGAINYDNTFGDVRVRVSAAGQYVSDDNDKLGDTATDSIWATSLGLRIGSGGFEGAIAWGHHNLDGAEFSKVPVDAVDVIGAGISYTDGPVGVSLTGAYGMVDVVDGDDATQLVVQLGGKYKLGPGVEARATLAYATSDDLIGATAENVPVGGSDFTGFGVVGGIRLVF